MATAPCRIWYQSFLDPSEQQPYFERLEAHLKACASPGAQFEVHGLSPPDRHLSLLTEFRCTASAIRNCIVAQERGYSAFVMGHFPDPGLVECRTAVEMPVIGLGEATLLHACTLGQKFALVTINPVFIPVHEDQIRKIGLQERCVGVRAIETQVATYMRAYEDPQAYQEVKDAFCQQVRPLIDAGAEVVIPSGGMPMLLFSGERGFAIDGAVVLDGLVVAVVQAEAAVRLHQLTGVGVSRRGVYRAAPREAIGEFLGGGS
jgi:Asp/Glu/hydantoin racemase